MGFIVVLLGFVASVALAIHNPRNAMLLIVFLVPWTGLMIDIGVQVTGYLLVLAGLVTASLLRLTQPGFRPLPIMAGSMLAAILLYATLLSLVQLGFQPAFKLDIGGALRGPTPRAILQIALFIFAFSPVLLFGNFARSRDDALLFGRIYVVSVAILAIIGWFQLATFVTTGTDPLPIGAVNILFGDGTAEARAGKFEVGALLIFRMNSFGYEPRSLGVALVFGMMLIQAQILTGIGHRVARLGLLWLFLFVTMLATFSTSAIGLWFLATPAMLPACWLFGVRIKIPARAIILGVTAILSPIVLGTIAAEANGIPIIAILSERTIERLTSDGAVEDFDLAILDFYKVHPEAAIAGVGLGNIHLYATPYLDPLYALYAQNNVFNAKTQYLKFISEIGLIGFALVLAWITRLTLLAAAVARRQDYLAPVVPAAAAFLVIYLGPGQTGPEFICLASALAIVAQSASRRMPAAAGRTALA